MKIAFVSTVYKRTPPEGYGGIERVVHTLVEELVRQGHEVTLFAVPGSHCSGKTVEVAGYDHGSAPSGIVSKDDRISEEPLYLAIREYLKDHPVDVIHDWSFSNLFPLRHEDEYPFVISICIPPPPGYKRRNLVAGSRAHAEICGKSTRYIYFGLDLDNWEYSYSKKDHFIHIAKIARYKAQHLAVIAAIKSGRKLVIAGNVEDWLYYYAFLKPLMLLSPNVKYIGEIKGTNRHLCDATALIMTPKWFDVFPLVSLESLASEPRSSHCRRGGFPEQVISGVNGFLCKTVSDIAEGMKNIDSIKPRACREYARGAFPCETYGQGIY